MSVCLPHHPLKHHWKPGCKPIWPSDFPPHWPPGSISKENLSPDVSEHFLTLCLETPSSPNSWERQDRRGLSKCVHTAEQPTSPPALSRPDKWKDYINMEKTPQFSNIHIYDFFFPSEIRFMSHCSHLADSQSFTIRLVSPSPVIFTLL